MQNCVGKIGNYAEHVLSVFRGVLGREKFGHKIQPKKFGFEIEAYGQVYVLSVFPIGTRMVILSVRDVGENCRNFYEERFFQDKHPRVRQRALVLERKMRDRRVYEVMNL